MDPLDYFLASRQGQIEYLFHSQPSLIPSDLDVLNAKNHNIKSLLYSTEKDEFTFINPNQKLSLNRYIGRPFILGIEDCFTLVRDYYKNELDIEIFNYNRNEEILKEDDNLIERNIEKENFKKVSFAEKHDILVFKYQGRFPHHMGIYIENDLFLQSWRGRMSNVELLTREYRNRISFIMRHKNLC